MLIASNEKVASLDEWEVGRAWVACELNDQIKDELNWSRKLHEEMVGLKIISEKTHQQLDESRTEMERTRVEVKT